MSVNDTMSFCFVCNEKLKDNYTLLSSSITPYSEVTYVEKICEFLGEDFVIIVNSTDRMCMKCTSFLIHVDMMENEIKLIINRMLSHIQNKYGITPPYQTGKIVEDAKMLNENLTAVEKSNPGQFKLPSSLPERENPTVTFAPLKTSTSSLKLQLQQKQEPQQVQNQQVQKQQYGGAKRKIMNKMNKYTQVHLRSPILTNKKKRKKPFLTQIAAGKKLNVVLPKKELNYVCIFCSTYYDNQSLYHKHIREKHTNNPTPLYSSIKTKKIYCPDTSKCCIQQVTLPQKNLKVDSPMDIDGNQQDNNNGTVDTDIKLSYNNPYKNFADTEQEEEIDNSSKAKNVKESKSINLDDLIKEEVIEEVKQDFDDRMEIIECSQVLLRNAILSNKKKLKKSIGIQITAGKKLIVVPPKKELNYVCLFCSTYYDNQSLYHKHVKEKHTKNPTPLYSSNKSENNNLFQLLSKPQYNVTPKIQKLGSPMDIDDDQQDNNNDIEDKEEIGNSSNVKTVNNPNPFIDTILSKKTTVTSLSSKTTVC